MLNVIDEPSSVLDRHFLLQQIVKETFRLRDDPAMREVCRRVARRHLADFPRYKRALKRDFGFLPNVSVFEHLARVLAEDGEDEDALRIAQSSIDYDVYDDRIIDDVQQWIKWARKKKAKLAKQ